MTGKVGYRCCLYFGFQVSSFLVVSPPQLGAQSSIICGIICHFFGKIYGIILNFWHNLWHNFPFLWHNFASKMA